MRKLPKWVRKIFRRRVALERLGRQRVSLIERRLREIMVRR